MPKNFYEVSWIFFAYSFFGWICEVIFAALDGQSLDRGMLFGPICPIYGFGMLAVVFTLYRFRDNVFVLFVGVVLLATAIELFGGFILEKIFNERWWDYSDLHFNFHGYICLKFSLLWGIGGTLVIGAIHPLVYRLIEKVPYRIGLPFLILVFAVFATDLIVTVVALIKLPKEMHAMVEIEKKLQFLSDKISLTLGGVTVAAANKGSELVEEQKVKLGKLKEEYSAKMTEFRQIAEGMGVVGKRIFKAFPDLKRGKFKPVFERVSALRHKDEKHETEQL